MTMAIAIASAIGAILLLGALSAGSALGLHLWRPQWTRRKRIFAAAGFAALLPMSLPLGGFLLEAGVEDPSDFTLGLLALVIFTIVIGAIVCLPAAWWSTRRVERAEGAPPLADHTQEPARIEA